MTAEYRALMARAWAATGHMRYRDIARRVGMPHASVHRYLTGATSGDRRRVLRLLLWIYGTHQPAIVARTMAAHDAARQLRLDVSRQSYLTDDRA